MKVSPPGSHTYAGQVTREYTNMNIPQPVRDPEPPLRSKPKPNAPPLEVNRKWVPPGQNPSLQSSYQNFDTISNGFDKSSSFDRKSAMGSQSAHYDTHTYVNINASNSKPELIESPSSQSLSSRGF